MEAAVYHAAGWSSTGLVRAGNEDSAYVGRHLYAVADGLGGHVAGDIASATVIESLMSCDSEAAPLELAEAMSAAVREANAALLRKIAQEPGLAGMGTTLTAMLWSGTTAVLAHIGDSRAYLLREGRFQQITEDHSLGKLLADVAGSGRPPSVMVRYLDGQPDRSPDLAMREVCLGDRYLLCSDGLSDVVTLESMHAVLGSAGNTRSAVCQLVWLAYAGGGPDNITVIVVDVQAAGAEPVPARPHLLGAAAR
jgi:serine/threonine protein phosphatase PrpC